MEIKSRLVFLDTNIFESKNFQFDNHSLKAFKKLVDDEEIRLLITDPTIQEVKQHIRAKSEEAVNEIKKVRRSAMLLRNTPDFPVHGIFEELTVDAVEDRLCRNFDEFLYGDNVEHVTIENVSASQVFDMYFNLRAPFANGEKRKEFPDAYVLLALDALSRTRGWPIHVITKDKDMFRFSEAHSNLICSESIDVLMDSINKIISIEPSEFAATAFLKVRDEAIKRINDSLNDITIDIIDYGNYDEASLEDVKFRDLNLIDSNLISVDKEYCAYSLLFSVSIDTVEITKDYDRSPFDREDDRYFFVLESIHSKSFQVKFSAELVIGYSDRIDHSIYIEEIITPDVIPLSDPYDHEVRHLDVNGD
ncbi:PIN domain-containing protein [Pseudomonas sp. NPDC087615]|uniref:PIN domain-containing protein n=1 Tax=Pseudomonas sp. NPDC087615 TaxID=3364443 RepID=UPI0037F655F3